MLIPTPRHLASVIFLLGSAAALSQAIPVLSRPYTAMEKISFVQNLADGTTITRETNVTMARDHQGRTRREETIPQAEGNQATYVVVVDPAARMSTNWTTLNKQAVRDHRPLALFPTPPEFGFVTFTTIISSGSAVLAAGPVLPGGAGVGFAGSVSDPDLKPTIKREKLEGKMFAGVYAEGRRITATYPVGSLGNDRPISIVYEEWTSPELNITLYTVIDDPRSGTQSTEVTSLNRSEPDAALFDPPADYEIKDIYPSNNSSPN